MRELFGVNLPAGRIALRDLEPGDVAPIVSFWHDSGSAHLRILNIDRDRLGTREDTAQRLTASIRTGEPDQRTITLAATVDEALIGFTNLNHYDEVENYPHVHIIERSMRSLAAVTCVFADSLKLWFDMLPISRIVLQTRTRVIGINRALDRYLPVAETRYFEQPDGLAGAGTFHLRYVHRDDLQSLLQRGEELRRQVITGELQASVHDR